ncbi:MAG: 4Fe-4S cluster-binding domain-containing protein [Deltaproteobacteria bacterium]|nr:4Fe-4S cluster-binding domain-containing protein [Deltaproteobacteria bacterium]
MDIIWNVTKRCGYKCSFCVSGGNNANKENELSRDRLDILIRSLSTLYTDDIDISGGEPLLHPHISCIIETLNYNYGRKIVSLTSAGGYAANLDEDYIRTNLYCYDFTYDYPHHLQSWHRDSSYNVNNILEACRIMSLGIKVKAQVPLFKDNLDMKVMSLLLNQLKEKGITKVQFIRLMPLGKQKLYNYPFDILNKEAIREIYEYSLSIGMDAELHCSLKGVLDKPQYVCNMIKEKIGINHTGTVFSCPWADHLNIDENPFKIGSLFDDNLDNIVSKNINSYKYNEDSCDLFNYILTVNDSPVKSDPLYS